MRGMPKTLVAPRGPQGIEMRGVRLSGRRSVPKDPMRNPPPDPSTRLRGLELRVNSLYAGSRAQEWGLTRPQFEAALGRSAGKQFAEVAVSRDGLAEYLETLHLEDLV